MLRGSWRAGERSGRWRARPIGRQATQQTLKPMVDAGAEWDAKRCEIRTSTAEAQTGKLKKGMKVKLSKVYKTCSDAAFGPLKEGQTGVVVQENQGADQPVNVRAPNGQTWWYQEPFSSIGCLFGRGESLGARLCAARRLEALHALGRLSFASRFRKDAQVRSSKASLSRAFPSLKALMALFRACAWPGAAYVELRVVRVGRTMPILGFAVMEEKEGKTILVRLAIIEGRTARKLDLSGKPEELPELERKLSKGSNKDETEKKRKSKKREARDVFMKEVFILLSYST